MDAWVLAQCMARLPRSTYFSHPEASLDDFFSGEANTIANGNGRGNDRSSSAGQRAAPHELRFLKSLSQSLGIHSPLANGRATTTEPGLGLGFHRDRGCVLPRGHSHVVSGMASSCHVSRTAMADEGRVTSGLSGSLDHRRPVASARGIRPSMSCSTSVSSSPYLSTSESVRAPGPPSTSPHLTPNVVVGRSVSPQPRIATKARTSGGGGSSQYQCEWTVAGGKPCGKWIEGGGKEVWVHVRKSHGLKGHYSGWCYCRWAGCEEKLKVSSLQRHLAKHLDIRWRCSNCDMIFARCDYARKHVRLSEDCHGANCCAIDPGETEGKSGQA